MKASASEGSFRLIKDRSPEIIYHSPGLRDTEMAQEAPGAPSTLLNKTLADHRRLLQATLQKNTSAP